MSRYKQSLDDVVVSRGGAAVRQQPAPIHALAEEVSSLGAGDAVVQSQMGCASAVCRRGLLALLACQASVVAVGTLHAHQCPHVVDERNALEVAACARGRDDRGRSQSRGI